MPVLSVVVTERAYESLRQFAIESDRDIDDLAAAAVENAAMNAEHRRRPAPVAPAESPLAIPTRAELALLKLAIRSPTGNPWPLIGIRQTVGGAKKRMFDKMKARGWFDRSNCITQQGRNAAGES